jgi:hypothetical protein
MNIFKNSINLLFGILFTSNFACQSAETTEGISNEKKESTINGISDLLNENYVFPEKAAQMGELLRNNLKSGAYEKINELDEFAEMLTDDLQSISKDKHLRIWNNSGEKMKQRNNGGAFQRNVNHGFFETKVLEGNIGYIDLRAFSGSNRAKPIAEAAMEKVSNTDALIIDLRKNGGVSPEMINTLTSYVFDGKEPVHLNTFYWRPTDSYQDFYTDTNINGKRMDNPDIYLLTSKYTFSAAEEFTYNLKNLKRATIVGETTGGGAHPVGNQRINTDFSMFLPQGRTIDPITKTNWEGTGIRSHIFVEADQALEKAVELVNNNIDLGT